MLIFSGVFFQLFNRDYTRVSMEVIVTNVSKLVDNLFTGRIQPTYIGVTIHLHTKYHGHPSSEFRTL